jgi:hypothetical protein
MVNSDGGWAGLAAVAKLWLLCEAEAVHQAEKRQEQNPGITVN